MIFAYILILLSSLTVLFIIIFLLSIQILAIFTTDAPFVSIANEKLNLIIDGLKLSENSVLYDLGCGDGRILIQAVKQFPNIKAVGIEVAFLPFLIAKFNTRKYKNIHIQRENIFKTDTQDATHIFLYLFPNAVSNLIPQIIKNSNTPKRIISCDFECADRKADEIIVVGKDSDKLVKKLFIYNI